MLLFFLLSPCLLSPLRPVVGMEVLNSLLLLGKNQRLDLPLSEEIKEYFASSTKTEPQVPCFREELKKFREQEIAAGKQEEQLFFDYLKRAPTPFVSVTFVMGDQANES